MHPRPPLSLTLSTSLLRSTIKAWNMPIRERPCCPFLSLIWRIRIPRTNSTCIDNMLTISVSLAHAIGVLWTMMKTPMNSSLLCMSKRLQDMDVLSYTAWRHRRLFSNVYVLKSVFSFTCWYLPFKTLACFSSIRIPKCMCVLHVCAGCTVGHLTSLTCWLWF